MQLYKNSPLYSYLRNPLIPTRSREWESFQVPSKLPYSTVNRSRCFDSIRETRVHLSFPSQSIHGCGYAAAKSISRRRRNHRYERHNSISGNRKEEQQPLPIFNIRTKVCAIEFYLQWQADMVNSKHIYVIEGKPNCGRHWLSYLDLD